MILVDEPLHHTPSDHTDLSYINTKIILTSKQKKIFCFLFIYTVIVYCRLTRLDTVVFQLCLQTRILQCYDTGLSTDRSDLPSRVSSLVVHMQGRGTASTWRRTSLYGQCFRWSAMLVMSANSHLQTGLKAVLNLQTCKKTKQLLT